MRGHFTASGMKHGLHGMQIELLEKLMPDERDRILTVQLAQSIDKEIT